MVKFIGRESELKKLTQLSQRKSASFIVIRGRRRIGKSRLIEEFSQGFDYLYSFTGLAPDKGLTKKDQLEEFSRQISRQFKTAFAKYEDWSDAFQGVSERIKKGKVLLFFDEISWMAMDDHSFLAKIKNFWDLYLTKNHQLTFIICSSASSWIEENILSSTGFVGRISYTLTLEELPLTDCSKFWPDNIAAYEKLKILSVTGGVPKYLEEVDPKLTAEENIKQLCFTKGAFLVDEFPRIFSDLFLKDSVFYKKIVTVLASGAKERNEICAMLDIDPNGRISEFLDELILAGFIKRDYTWDIHNAKDSKLSKYRLKDNYLRFYLKYIDKNISKINRDLYTFKSLGSLPEWNSHMGLQFENLVLNNRTLVHQALNINLEDIVLENPFYQHKTSRITGCQIDYMIQTRFNVLYICEIKFSKNILGVSVIADVQTKLKSLHYPKGYSIRPVLIHVNEISEEIKESSFFTNIIDFTQFL